MSVFQLLENRGYVYQSTDNTNIRKLLEEDEKINFYMGIDPTADSLHIGHFFALMMFRYLQDAGHKGILVIGGATALIGDPTGKQDMRKMLTYDEVDKNIKEVEKLSKQFINMEGSNPAIILNNADWINPYNYVNFMRDIGVHFNVNTMLNSDVYEQRLEQGGLTFLEMGYMLMQAYDFEYLNRTHNCILQIGGSDQWGNIVAGVSLHRKMNVGKKSDIIYGLTCPLLTSKDGKKMGKTESGTLWVAREKTTVYDFYQYFYNVADENIEKLLCLFTKISLEEIKEMISENILKAKRVMSYEITKLVHGEDEANKAIEAVSSLFNNEKSNENIPTVIIPFEDIKNGMDVLSFIKQTGLLDSKSEARRLIQQGGILINGEKVLDVSKNITDKDIQDDSILVKRGKKTFIRVKCESSF